MANVTDAAFRRMIAKYGKPDVIFTEFVSCHGLCSKGKEKLLQELIFHKSERPIVAQIWGVNPEYFYKTAKMLKKMGFDGIDINMGCPEKNVEKMGSGAKLMQNPRLAKKIIEATKKGAGALPVSVKTRLGYDKNNIEKWMKYLLEAGPDAIIIHARTRKEMSKVPAHWDMVAKAVKIAEKYNPKKDRPKIIGNGDVKSLAEAEENVKKYGVDGVMVGRGVFGNPWFFNKKIKYEDITPKEKIEVMLEHARLFEKIFGKEKNFDTIKKHFKSYISGFSGAKNIRARLMKAKNLKETENIIKKITVIKK